jgi:hypothetical protein
LKIVVQGGCRDNMGFSRVAGGMWEGAVWESKAREDFQRCSLRLGNLRKPQFSEPYPYTNPSLQERRPQSLDYKPSVH